MSAPGWTQPVDLGQDDVRSSGAEHVVSVSNSMPRQSATSSKKQKTSDTILSLAVILDPRYKIQFVKFCLNKVEVDECLVEKKLSKICGVLKSLFEEYVVESERSCSQQTPNSLLGLGSSTTSSASKRHIELDEFDLQDNIVSTRSEVDIYLEEKKLPTTVNLDILKYWKYSSDRFPTLSMLARDILTIPITTVASESAFSIGSKVLTKYRTSLLPENAEALICGRNWLNGYEVESDEPTDEDLHFSLLPWKLHVIMAHYSFLQFAYLGREMLTDGCRTEIFQVKTGKNVEKNQKVKAAITPMSFLV